MTVSKSWHSVRREVLKIVSLDRTSLTLGHLAQWSGAEHRMPVSLLKKQYRSVWMDSRKVTAGDVFLALKSEQDDGHRYVESAFKAGAIAAIVARRSEDMVPKRFGRQLLLVSDPLRAIQRCAVLYRKTLSIPFIAVTGSSGKTSTRRFITTVLSEHMQVYTPDGNWNNHIGVPLSILRMSGEQQVAVFELGANHLHEISGLTKIVKPDIGIITNVGYAHIGLFGNLDATTNAKFEIAEGVPVKKGMLLLNGDDQRLVKKSRHSDHKAVFFGLSSRCEVRARNVIVESDGRTTFTMDGHKYCLSIPGRHFMYCALPAIYLGRLYGMAEKVIADVLATIVPDAMRGRIVEKKGVRFIVDCYNANPSSMKAGITLLEDVARTRRCAVIGDMRELGKYAPRCHKQLGEQIARAGLEKLVVVGEYADTVARSALSSGMKSSQVHCTADSQSAVAIAKNVFTEGDTVLLKASRGIKLETIFEQF